MMASALRAIERRHFGLVRELKFHKAIVELERVLAVRAVSAEKTTDVLPLLADQQFGIADLHCCARG